MSGAPARAGSDGPQVNMPFSCDAASISAVDHSASQCRADTSPQALDGAS